jgi:hypothetical protein
MVVSQIGRRLALGIRPVRQVGDRLLKALRDSREVLLVGGDQRRVGLGGEAAGRVITKTVSPGRLVTPTWPPMGREDCLHDRQPEAGAAGRTGP